MQKVVISGSVSLQQEIQKWREKFTQLGFEVIDWPKPIEHDKFVDIYPGVHKEFYVNICKADILFVLNKKKYGVEGYIGAETFAEVAFGVSQNLLHNQGLEIVILNKLSGAVQSREEVELWRELGWIVYYKDSNLNTI
jgi:hypothetical protein